MMSGGIFNYHFIANLPPNLLVKKKSKIDQHLAKLWARVELLFDSWCVTVCTVQENSFATGSPWLLIAAPNQKKTR